MDAVIIVHIQPESDGSYFYDDGFYDAEYISRKLEVILRENFGVDKIKVVLLDSES